MPDTLEGDFNGDGVVDAADYAAWRGALGDVPTRYTEWAAAYGATAAPVAVPEPGTALIAFFYAASRIDKSVAALSPPLGEGRGGGDAGTRASPLP